MSFKENVVCSNAPLPPGTQMSAVLVDGTMAGKLLVKLLGETTRQQAVEMLSKALEKLKE